MSLTTKTIGQLLDENTYNHPNHTAVIYVDENRRVTWLELKNLVDNAARAFLALGVNRGEQIAIWGTNKLEWLITQYASAKIGAALVTINPEWKAAELEYAVKQSDTKILVMIEGFEKRSADKVYQYNYIDILTTACPDIKESQSSKLILSKFPELKNIILITQKIPPLKAFIKWDDFLLKGNSISDAEYKERVKAVNCDDVCLIQYTSGTTGFPKGAMLTHYNVINNALSVAKNLELTHSDRVCIPVPYYHCFGSVLGNLICLTQATTMVVPAEHYNANKTLAAIDKEKCTLIYGVPSMFISELSDPEFSRFNLSSLRSGIMAGAPCPIELMKDVVEKMGAKKITITYGLTEASPATHQTRPEDSIYHRVSTIGKPIDNVESKIVDPVTFKELGTDEVGEIWVRGPNIMKGYYKNPEETKKAIVEGGWLRTGDLGTRDKDGYFKIVGRYKDMVIVGGHNVYPAEVENLMLSEFGDEIEQIQIVGVPHKVLQEVLAAAIKLKQGKTLTLEQIKQRLEDKTEWPKIPRHLKIVNDFSNVMTVTGKIQKFKLKELLIKEFGLEDLANIKTA